MVKIYLGGIDKTQYCKPKSLKIDMDSSHYKTCSVTLYNMKITDGVPEEGEIIRVDLIGSNGTPIMLFEGHIDSKPSIKQMSPNSDKLEVQLSSNGYRFIPYRRTVTETYDIPVGAEYITAKQIIQHLITTYLVVEGVQFLEIGVIEGKHYDDTQEFICMSIGDIFDKLAQDSNANWYINQLKVLYFDEEYYSFNGLDMYDIDTDYQMIVDFRNPEVSTSLQNYANKVFFKGDIGEETSVFKQDDAEIAHMASLDGGSGVYGCTVDNPSITTQAEAEAYCQKILDKRKAKPKTLKFDTFNVLDYQVGQMQTMNIPLLGIVKPGGGVRNYIVERISLSDFDGKRLTKNVEMKQLFPNGMGGITWSKSAQGVDFFKRLVQIANNQETLIKNMIKSNPSGSTETKVLTDLKLYENGMTTTYADGSVNDYTFAKDTNGMITTMTNTTTGESFNVSYFNNPK